MWKKAIWHICCIFSIKLISSNSIVLGLIKIFIQRILCHFKRQSGYTEITEHACKHFCFLKSISTKCVAAIWFKNSISKWQWGPVIWNKLMIFGNLPSEILIKQKVRVEDGTSMFSDLLIHWWYSGLVLNWHVQSLNRKLVLSITKGNQIIASFTTPHNTKTIYNQQVATKKCIWWTENIISFILFKGIK